MFTSENIQEFAQRLAEHRPAQVFSMFGTHSVEYMDTTQGEAAYIDVTMPGGMSVILENGTTGRVVRVCIMLPQEDE